MPFNAIIFAAESENNSKSISEKAMVSVQINENLYHFSELPRIDEVLAHQALEHNWYWPSTALFELGDLDLESRRKVILAKLDKLKTNHLAEQQIFDAISNLQSQINQWQLAKRIILPINYDLARISPENNPRFEAGNYLLKLQLRSESITAFGLVKMPTTIEHKGGSSFNYYVTDMKILSVANNSELYIIQPDGKVNKAGYAYFNQSSPDIMPGSRIFVPFKSELFSTELDAINQEIVELAINWIPQ